MQREIANLCIDRDIEQPQYTIGEISCDEASRAWNYRWQESEAHVGWCKQTRQILLQSVVVEAKVLQSFHR